MHRTAGRKSVDFFPVTQGPPAQLWYFTKKRFMEALTRAASGGLKRIAHIYSDT
jgi:hypothetical protein